MNDSSQGYMKLQIPNEIAESAGLSEADFMEFIAVSLYKARRINGVQGGKLIGKSEVEFHGLLQKYGEYVNYDVEQYLEDSDSLKDF